MADVDIVMHAAAMTHVEVVEVTPVEAGTSTVFGTQHVIGTAIDVGVNRVLLTSSERVAHEQFCSSPTIAAPRLRQCRNVEEAY